MKLNDYQMNRQIEKSRHDEKCDFILIPCGEISCLTCCEYPYCLREDIDKAMNKYNKIKEN